MASAATTGKGRKSQESQAALSQHFGHVWAETFSFGNLDCNGLKLVGSRPGRSRYPTLLRLSDAATPPFMRASREPVSPVHGESSRMQSCLQGRMPCVV